MGRIDLSGLVFFGIIGIVAVCAVIIAVPILCWFFFGKAVVATIGIFYLIIWLFIRGK